MRTQVVKIIMRKVLQAIDGLHSLGIVHRDIKPQNILITVAGICPERPHPEPGT
jgi:serine/threonine protein kinase